MIADEQKWYPLWRQNSVLGHGSEIQSTPLLGHPALTSEFEPTLVVTRPAVAEMFKSVIDEMTCGTNFSLINLLLANHAIPTTQDPNRSIDEPEN
jgi:hypothetical protein